MNVPFLIQLLTCLTLFMSFFYYFMRDEFKGMSSNTSYSECLYFSLSTSLLVGFGDITPKTQRSRFLVICHMILIGIIIIKSSN